MDWRLELVVVPVSDIERSKRFYADQVGFRIDQDQTTREDTRVVQLTPPGSPCSIVLSTRFVDMRPGALYGLQLVVPDVRRAHAWLTERGVPVSHVQVFDAGGFRASRDGDALDDVGFVFFKDPDGNRWAVQQISRRAPAGTD